MIQLEIRKNAYYDSVTLMLISREVKALAGVEEALVGMGTELNHELAAHLGLNAPGFDAIGANDLFVAVRCADEAAFQDVLDTVDRLLSKKADSGRSAYRPPSLDGALKQDSALNMAVISVPGKFAADLAQDCLERDINVMLFSDNVTVDEELALKQFAAARGLLVMGPDCGTAIINHVPLAFANVVRPGDIGIVAASGTGTQEVSSLIDQLGGGVSQVIGTGGRDLKAEIGGIMMELGLDALANDPETKVIVLISKPPAPEIADQILKQAARTGKPIVVSFIGGDPAMAQAHGLHAALSLEDAARKAVALSNGTAADDFTGFAMGQAQAEALAGREAAGMAQGQKYLRGLYTGGTLCDEAMKLLIGQLGHIYSNIPLNPADGLEDPRGGESVQHTFLDFGDDAFTVGRPHPMIDPSLRAERVAREGADPATAVVLVDCVIGYGSHPDPAHDLAAAIRAAKGHAAAAGGYLSVVAAVCGTQGDPQGLAASRKQLEDAGAIVLPSNAQAAQMARLILSAKEAR